LKDKNNVFTDADRIPQINGKQGKPSISLVCWITEVVRPGINLQQEKKFICSNYRKWEGTDPTIFSDPFHNLPIQKYSLLNALLYFPHFIM